MAGGGSIISAASTHELTLFEELEGNASRRLREARREVRKKVTHTHTYMHTQSPDGRDEGRRGVKEESERGGGGRGQCGGFDGRLVAQ